MRFENDAAERLAERLAAFAPPGLTWSFFSNGGSEALDSAVKLVRQYWLDRGQPEKWKVIGRRPGFHGNTLMALSVRYHAGQRARYLPYITVLPHLPFPAEAGVTARIDQATREAGLLVYPCAGIIDGVVGDSILMVPPLVISREEIGLLVDRLDSAIDAVSRAVLA